MSASEQARGGPAIEVVAKATRRRFAVEYKRKIVRAVDACKTAGAIGALLRQEGLYSSHLTTWRAARERADLAGPTSKKRGPATRVVDGRDKRIAELERENSVSQREPLCWPRPTPRTRSASRRACLTRRRMLASLDQSPQTPAALADVIDPAAAVVIPAC